MQIKTYEAYLENSKIANSSSAYHKERVYWKNPLSDNRAE